MSRIGKMIIAVPDNVTIKIEKNNIKVAGPKGELSLDFLPVVSISLALKEISVSVKNPEDSKEKPFWGLYRSLISNMIIGVTTGFEKKLDFNGVGYSVVVKDGKMNLNLGYSHPIHYELPKGVTALVEKNIITFSGIDKQIVGQVAAQIRKMRKIEPYKLKGIKYVGEVVVKKAGKLAKSVGK